MPTDMAVCVGVQTEETAAHAICGLHRRWLVPARPDLGSLASEMVGARKARPWQSKCSQKRPAQFTQIGQVCFGAWVLGFRL